MAGAASRLGVFWSPDPGLTPRAICCRRLGGWREGPTLALHSGVQGLPGGERTHPCTPPRRGISHCRRFRGSGCSGLRDSVGWRRFAAGVVSIRRPQADAATPLIMVDRAIGTLSHSKNRETPDSYTHRRWGIFPWGKAAFRAGIQVFKTTIIVLCDDGSCNGKIFMP